MENFSIINQNISQHLADMHLITAQQLQTRYLGALCCCRLQSLSD